MSIYETLIFTRFRELEIFKHIGQTTHDLVISDNSFVNVDEDDDIITVKVSSKNGLHKWQIKGVFNFFSYELYEMITFLTELF